MTNNILQPITNGQIGSSVRSQLNLLIAGATIANIDMANQYGILADGVTDNATALMKMQSDLAGSNVHYNLLAPSGTILYSNNRWLHGIKSFDLWGNGSTFSSTVSGSDDKLTRAFFAGDAFMNNGLSYTGGITYNYCPPFNTSVAGSTSITLTTSSDTSYLAVGNRILLWGYDQVGNGFPPGCRYFEYNFVTGLPGSGVVNLKYPLKNTYNTAWWDVPNLLGSQNSGIPRLAQLDVTTGGNTDPGYSWYAGYHDLTWGTDSNATGLPGYEVQHPANFWYMERVICATGSTFTPSMNQYALFEDCTFDLNEFDKLTDIVECRRCTFVSQGPVGGGGINTLRLIDCNSLSASFQLFPRNLEVIGGVCTSGTTNGYLALQVGGGANPTRHAVLDNLRLIGLSSATNTSFLGTPGYKSLTLSSSNIQAAATFTATISGTVLTSTSVTHTILANALLTGTGVTAGTRIISQVSGTTGGAGTYNISHSYSLGSGFSATATPTDIIIPWVSWTDATTTAMPYGAEANYTRLFKSDFSNGGLITNIIWDSTIGGSGGWRIMGNWNIAPVSTDVYRWFLVLELIDGANHHVVNWGSLLNIYDSNGIRWAGNKGSRGRLHSASINSDGLNWITGATAGTTLNLLGKIVDIEVNIGKPFTGVGSQVLTIYNLGGQTMTIDLTTTGRQILSQFQAYGSVGSDSFSANTNLGNFNATQPALYTSLDILNNPDIPEIEIIIRWKEY